MISFLVNNGATIIVSIILIAIVGSILYNMFKGKKAGKSSCGCNCGNCPSAGLCHGPKK